MSKFWGDENGDAPVLEYGLLAAGIAVAIILGLTALDEHIGSVLQDADVATSLEESVGD